MVSNPSLTTVRDIHAHRTRPLARADGAMGYKEL